MTDETNTIDFVQNTFDSETSDAARAMQGRRLEEVHVQFRQDGNNYYYHDIPDVVAFTDYGDRIASHLENVEVAEAMTKLAYSKGWEYYLAKGSDKFYAAAESQTERMTDDVEQPVKAVNEAAQAESKPAKQPRMSNTVAGEVINTADDETEQLRRQTLAEAVNNQYRVAGSKYYFKDQAGHVNKLAFKDTGKKLATALNTERVTRSLVDLAESKGWTTIKVSGHKEFKRLVWRAAAERGIEVQGYKPDKQDLATIPEKPLTNTVQAVKSAVNEPDTDSTPAAEETPAAKAKRDVTGKLVEHGAAPYQNDANNKPSYFVTIDTGEEMRTVWGVKLPDALAISNAQIGEQVQLRRVQAEPVTVKEDTGTEVQTVRNSWTVERTDKRQVIAAVADALAEQQIPDKSDRQRVANAVNDHMNKQQELPQIQMYDNAATQSAVVDRAKATTKAPELVR